MSIWPKPKVIFILSCTRSGSTWLGYVLGSCHNSAFLGEYYRAWDERLKQPCTWCAAHGDDNCEVLGGIETVPFDEAFPFAAARTGAEVLIDTSKSIPWALRQIEANNAFDFKLVHLIRDPRGWYASERRRCPNSAGDLLDRWSTENRSIAGFLESSRLPSYTLFYEELAAEPESTLHPLCDFAGLRFGPAALRYWERTHHGFAANGASSFLLDSQREKTRGLKFLLTGDDPYYARHRHRLFVDDRWKTVLTAAEVEEIAAREDLQSFLAGYEREMRPDGIVPSAVAAC